LDPNPGPTLSQLQMPNDLKSSHGLRFFHLNVRSLINKMDFLRVWADTTGVTDQLGIMLTGETRVHADRFTWISSRC